MIIAQIQLICSLELEFTTPVGAPLVAVAIFALALNNRHFALGAIDERESPTRL
jgi:hypothetical protein